MKAATQKRDTQTSERRKVYAEKLRGVETTTTTTKYKQQQKSESVSGRAKVREFSEKKKEKMAIDR